MTREDDDEEIYDCLEDQLDDIYSDDALGSCDNCGMDLHYGDDLENCLCDQCAWELEQS